MVIKSKKNADTDPLSYSVFQALETTEMLLVSEYSYEKSFNQRYKSQDYDFFQELVGKEEHVDDVLNLHRVFLSLLLKLEDELIEMTAQDKKLF